MSLLPLWTSQELCTVMGAGGVDHWNCAGVSIDSRTIEEGDLFLALDGPNFDGHGYVLAAFEKGAAGAVVSRYVEGVDTARQILVTDVKSALIKLGAAGRGRVKAKIIAVTGSAGKTGTKEALKAALSRHKKTHASVLSYNNDVGVPLSLARMPYDTEYGVFEIGMNHKGEIADLVKLVRPHVAIITTVDLAHSEYFTSVEDIADAKAEIFTAMEEGGVAILNHDNAHFDRLFAQAKSIGVKEIISFGATPEADVNIMRHFLHDTCSCVIADIRDIIMTYKVGMLGHHWVMNSLAVLAAVDVVGGDLGLAGLGLAEVQPLAGRGRRHRIYFDGEDEASFLLIDESYNANPASMQAAIATLGQTAVQRRGRRLAVLGDMAELGERSAALHAGLGDSLADAKIDRIYKVGKHMKNLTVPGIPTIGCTDREALYDALYHDLCDGDVIMIKGSNASGMSWVVQKLVDLDYVMEMKAANG